MTGQKPLKNRNGRELLNTAEYRAHLELYGDRVSSIFAGISPKVTGSNGTDVNLTKNKSKDIDMGFTNNGLR